MKRARTLLLCLCLLVPLVAVIAGPAKALGGPVVLMGIDAEDGNICCGAHGGLTPYASVVADLLGDTSNGGNGILVIGGGKAAGDDVTQFWAALGSAVGETVTQVNGAAAISAQCFAGFQMIGVASATPETFSGGLDNSENDALGARQADVANFVNGGGGLVGFSQTGMTNPYQYIAGVGSFTFNTGLSYADVDATTDGEAVGLSDTNMDVCCWHDEYLTYPSFLSVLANNVASGQAAALGGANVVIPTNITLSPATATNPAGTSHTVTATVKDANNVPQVGVPVTFVILSGPNAGASGTCVPATCQTDSNGQVTFTYTSNGNAGTDIIDASFVDAQGNTQHAQAAKTWEKPIRMTGRAFGIYANVLGVIVQPTPDTGPVDTDQATTVSPPCVATITGSILNATALCANVTTTVDPASSTATASVAKARLLVPGVPLITATAAESISRSDCSGSTGEVKIARLTIGLKTFLNVRGRTNIPVGDGFVRVNEQVPFPGGLTVNAVHVFIPGVVDVIIASATSDIHDCPAAGLG